MLIIDDVVIAIPAYKPTEQLLPLIVALSESGAKQIIVIDDGGGEPYRHIFDHLRALPGVSVLTHAINLGKGAALKTAINHALVQYPNMAGVVTADADGQHDTADILAVATALHDKPDHFVLGARSFDSDTPMRSKIGNTVSRWLYQLLLNLKLRDTQTGLRGLPKRLCEAGLRIRSNRYEFETEMLTMSSSLRLPIMEISIRTIYEDGNVSSHFNPLFDSLRIYFVVFRYILSSIGTALVDLAVFVLLAPIVPGVVAVNLLSRSVALFVQFALLRSFVFKADAGLWRFCAFVAYVAAMGVVSGVLQGTLSESSGLGAVPAKIVVECAIFVFNFLFLRDILFRRRMV